MPAIRNHGASRNDAASHTIRSCNGVPASRARVTDSLIRATVVVDLDELIVRATWSTHAEFTDDQLSRSSCRSSEWRTSERTRRDDKRPAVECSRVYRGLIRSKYSPRSLCTCTIQLVEFADRFLWTKSENRPAR